MNAFICLPHSGIRLTRSACAKRHRSAVSEYGSRNQGKTFSESCSTCTLGAAHMRGEAPSTWDSGRAVVEVELVPLRRPDPLIPARALLRSEPARRRHKGRVLEVG